MSKAIFEPNGLNLIILNKDFTRLMEALIGNNRIPRETLSILEAFQAQLNKVAILVKPTHYEERDGVPSKKQVPNRISKKTDAMVRQYTVRRSSGLIADRGGPDTEPSPTEFERYNSDPDVG